MNAPEKIVVQLELRGRLEGCHLAALRIHGVEDAANGAVLTGGVATLKDDEDRIPRIGVQRCLKFANPVGRFLECLLQLVVLCRALRWPGVGVAKCEVGVPVDGFQFHGKLMSSRTEAYIYIAFAAAIRA